jgi:hypothetical protein
MAEAAISVSPHKGDELEGVEGVVLLIGKDGPS